MSLYMFVVCIDIHVYTKDTLGKDFVSYIEVMIFFFDLRLVKIARIH